MSGIRVTVEDLETGESESQEIEDNYVVVTAGVCHVAHNQFYPQKGTHLLTIKNVGGIPGEPTSDRRPFSKPLQHEPGA